MAPLNLNVQTALVTTTIGAIIVLGLYLYQKRAKKNAIPTVWDPVGKVARLYMYPLKSGRRMELNTAECTDYGFKLKDKSAPHLRDRCLLVYKEGIKEFKTARTYPKLLSISVTSDGEDYFSVTAPGMEKLQIKVPSLSENYKTDEVVMWENEKVFTIDCGEQAARWVSRYILGDPSGLRLGFHDALHRRNIKKTHQKYLKIYTNLDNSATGMYTDLTSYLLMNQASVDELVSRIPTANITMNNFRPNIVVNGDKITPYCEDNWDWVKIGPVVFRNVKSCTRCALTTIDPETCIKSQEHEPIKTLKTYRKLKDLTKTELEGESPVLGIHMGLTSAGEINVGDIVYLGRN